MSRRTLALVGSLAAGMLVAAGSVATASPASGPPVISDSSLKASFTTIGGGAKPLPTARTVKNWAGTTTDPHNGVTYGYNMVGADPNTCSGTACDASVQVDITPLVVVVGGRTFDGSAVLPATLASPQFATNDYGTTPAATAAGSFPNPPREIRGPGGLLSQADAGNQLQLEDATMRAQFNKTGASGYHLRLTPTVHAPVTITVPSNQGVLLQSGRGVVFADVSISWWAAQIGNLENSADPTHLPLYLTDDVMLFTNGNPLNCCVIGFHGNKAPGVVAKGRDKSQGNAPLQTFAWASYVSPGLFARRDGGTDWALQDIHALSHEIAEWADDPFVNNGVEPWVTPTAPQYGCTGVLETGDPVVAIGFAKGTNTFRQGPNPDGTQSADGYYHPEDEALLPWFMRLPANATESEPTQGGTGGRYTFMGDLNPFPGFRAPATGC